VPSARDDVGADERDAQGRLFKGYAADEPRLQSLPFTVPFS